MKIPKKLRMLGYDWKVVTNKRETGGSFDWGTKIITIGDKYGEKEAIFLHEIMEAILSENGCRFYGDEKSMEYRFFFDHSGLCKFHRDLYAVLKDNGLI